MTVRLIETLIRFVSTRRGVTPPRRVFLPAIPGQFGHPARDSKNIHDNSYFVDVSVPRGAMMKVTLERERNINRLQVGRLDEGQPD